MPFSHVLLECDKIPGISRDCYKHLIYSGIFFFLDPKTAHVFSQDSLRDTTDDLRESMFEVGTVAMDLNEKQKERLARKAREERERQRQEAEAEQEEEDNPEDNEGGGTGAIIVCLPNLETAFTTRYFLVDLETGEVFTFITQMWRRTGLYCARQPHNTEDLK